mgnify:FL=1|tara:strand:- start:16 stop:204 length:189 start_codon:yes stop_codon:yes gene_type:complete
MEIRRNLPAGKPEKSIEVGFRHLENEQVLISVNDMGKLLENRIRWISYAQALEDTGLWNKEE